MGGKQTVWPLNKKQKKQKKTNKLLSHHKSTQTPSPKIDLHFWRVAAVNPFTAMMSLKNDQ